MSPVKISPAMGEARVIPIPGLVVTVVQAVWTWVPGCSGNVVPGAPGSANAGSRRGKTSLILLRLTGK
jgi:hypothetical protein